MRQWATHITPKVQFLTTEVGYDKRQGSHFGEFAPCTVCEIPLRILCSPHVASPVRGFREVGVYCYFMAVSQDAL